jgi:hypothetical protein
LLRIQPQVRPIVNTFHYHSKFYYSHWCTNDCPHLQMGNGGLELRRLGHGTQLVKTDGLVWSPTPPVHQISAKWRSYLSFYCCVIVEVLCYTLKWRGLCFHQKYFATKVGCGGSFLESQLCGRQS